VYHQKTWQKSLISISVSVLLMSSIFAKKSIRRDADPGPPRLDFKAAL
jgi:hypothetical protein